MGFLTDSTQWEDRYITGMSHMGLPHGALPSARSSHDEPFKVPGTWSANSLGDPSSWGAVGLRLGLVASRLGLRERVPRTSLAQPHGTNSGAMLSHRSARFVDDARAVFGNRTTI